MLSQYPDLPENHTLDLLGEERERERDENNPGNTLIENLDHLP